jgi:hypothetical protein
MIELITVEHITFVSDRSFQDVVRAFEEQVGTLEELGWPAIPAASRDQDDFERRVREVLGPSGFTRFLTIDHGEWVSKQERSTRLLMYTIGNPLIAITMMRHDIEAGLDVPVKPSSLMSGLRNVAVQDAACKLDAKLMALGEAVTGVRA